MKRRERITEQWSAVLTPAEEYEELGGDYYNYQRQQIIVVRIVLGKNRITFGWLAVCDEQFDDKITTMKAAAEERASSLNAVEVRNA